ncbi:Uncharacterised protein r2_g83 [Pycnogonum litorale]
MYSILARSRHFLPSEIVAIATAARLAIDNGSIVENNGVLVLSDSRVVIKALTRLKSKMVSNCVGALKSLAADKRVTVRWVRAHVGIDGNERADSLAKRGANTLSFQTLLSQRPWLGPTESEAGAHWSWQSGSTPI